MCVQPGAWNAGVQGADASDEDPGRHVQQPADGVGAAALRPHVRVLRLQGPQDDELLHH